MEQLTQTLIHLISIGRIKLFYKRGGWKRKRREILQRDNYECQRCKEKGKHNQATTVHHIQHLDKRPDLALIDENLVSLCDTCHNEAHPEKFPRPAANRKANITLERW